MGDLLLKCYLESSLEMVSLLALLGALVVAHSVDGLLGVCGLVRETK